MNAYTELSGLKPEPETYTIIKRLDGYYWESELTGCCNGPFNSRLAAEADVDSSVDGLEPEHRWEETEIDVGFPDWMDDSIGLPAEGFVARMSDY